MDRNNDYYSDRKFCPACNQYVPYLMSLSTSFCAECGGEVRLFSKADWEAFAEKMEARKPKGRRRGKKTTGGATQPPRKTA